MCATPQSTHAAKPFNLKRPDLRNGAPAPDRSQ